MRIKECLVLPVFLHISILDSKVQICIREQLDNSTAERGKIDGNGGERITVRLKELRMKVTDTEKTVHIIKMKSMQGTPSVVCPAHRWA